MKKKQWGKPKMNVIKLSQKEINQILNNEVNKNDLHKLLKKKTKLK